VLVHAEAPWYDIPVAEARTAWEVGKWVLHLANKRWVSAEDLGYMVQAVRDINKLWSW
jgi:hypothetical protein